MKNTVILLVFIFVIATVFLLRTTRCGSSLGECDLSGNQWVKQTSDHQGLPDGYVLDNYSVEEVTEIFCNQNSECETPMDYLVQSRCPFTSICLQNKCTVVCPHQETVEIQGKIINIEPEKDGLMITIENAEKYDVLISIANLGEKYISSIESVEVGKYIQVTGTKISFTDSERVIASQIYAEGVFQGEHPCNLEPDAGSCEATIPKYYFDKKKSKCKEFYWGGCDGTAPFDNLDVCKKSCEALS